MMGLKIPVMHPVSTAPLSCSAPKEKDKCSFLSMLIGVRKEIAGKTY